MGGWPSTTGNPSGGGRWNNEPDDDYEDEEGCGEGGYTPPISSYSYFNSRRDDMHYRNRCNFDLEGLREETQEESERVHQKKRSQEWDVANLGRLIGEKYYGCCHWEDYDEYAQKYFGTESLSDFANSILGPLVECHKRVEDFKRENQSELKKLSHISQLPKVSKRDHILISEGLINGPIGSHIINGRITSESQYLWKTNLDDESESYKIVHHRYTGVLSHEYLEHLTRLRDEFEDLHSDMEQKKIPVIQCYHIFQPAYHHSNDGHWMAGRDTQFRQLRSRFHSLLGRSKDLEHAFHQLSDHENPYEEIYNNIKNDHEEALLELEKCVAESDTFDTEYDKRHNKIKEAYGF